MSHPIPSNENDRLAALDSYEILDSLPEQAYDDIARLAAQVCGVERAMVAFVDETRKWHKARFNVGITEVPRDFAICSHAILSDQPLIVDDTHKHPALANLGMVVNPPHVRFYAGVPLVDEHGYALGTLCAIDSVPRTIDADQVESMVALARQVMQLLKLRKSIHQLEKREQQLQLLSVTDYLTGLFNRRALQQQLDLELESAKSQHQPLSLLVLDIDHFKRFNDRFGHNLGDKVLIKVANTLQSQARSEDFVARFGGEEFVILLPETDSTEAQQLAEQYRNAVKNIMFKGQQVTISIGAASYDQSDDGQQLFQLADSALLEAKRSGRNCVKHYNPSRCE